LISDGIIALGGGSGGDGGPTAESVSSSAQHAASAATAKTETREWPSGAVREPMSRFKLRQALWSADWLAFIPARPTCQHGAGSISGEISTLQKKLLNIMADYAERVDKWNIQLISEYLAILAISGEYLADTRSEIS